MQRAFLFFIVFGPVFGAYAHGRAKSLGPITAGPSWSIVYSPAMPPVLSGQSGAYFFDFPSSKDGVHYVIQQAPAVQLGQTITMVFSLHGSGKLLANEGRSAAKVRLFVQRLGDTMTANEPYKRWWSLAHAALISPGTFKLSAKIDPSAWSSVFGAVGHSASAEFADCISNLAHWGFTFGGDFAGHGVYAKNGKIRFVLKDYGVSSQTSETD
jgi:hypothetical protein